jgi:hypothetical protein
MNDITNSLSVTYWRADARQIKIRLNAENISDIVAWQAGIEYDSERIKITDIQSSTFDQFDEQVWRVDENSVRIAWVNERNQSTTIKDPDTFIEITAETSKDILSDEMLIWFDHEILPFLVFDSKGEVLPVQFEYEIIADEDAGNRESLVASASPNPFTDYVSFQIPELNTIDAQVQLSTLNGSLILDQTVQFEKGTAKLRSSDLLTLPGGIYTATILSKSGVTYHVKLIK